MSVYSSPSVFTAQGVSPIVATAAASADKSPVPRAAVSDLLLEASERYAIPVDLLSAIGWRESHFRQAAVSSKGAIGVMQLMSNTAHELRVDPYDLRENILGGAAYLRLMLDRYHGNIALALGSYNAGPGAVDRYRGVPPYEETQSYVRGILAAMDTPATQPVSDSVLVFDP